MAKTLKIRCRVNVPCSRSRVASCTRGFGHALVIAIGVVLSISTEAQATAGALDLLDPTPRDVVVSFEVSPRESPAQTNAEFSREFKASLEPGARPSEVRVVIPAKTVEEHLLGSQRPIPNSFSDFVWTFDVETGHVISAHLQGRVTPELDWGFMTTETEADIQVEMGTARIGGFKRPRRILGQLVFSYCTNTEDPGCHLVETAPFDRATGYVNAIGQVWVHSTIVDLWNFSPMGEAIFREVDRPRHGFAEDEVAVGSSRLPGVSVMPEVPVPASTDLERLQ